MNKVVHNLEEISQNPGAVLFTNEGFVTSYLAQKLLELPIKLTIISEHSIDELQHLKQNERVSVLEGKESSMINSPEIKSADYLFILIDANNPNIKDKIEQTKTLVNQNSSSNSKILIVLLGMDNLSNCVDLVNQIKSGEAEGGVKDTRFIITFDVYGPTMPRDSSWEFSKFISQIQKGQSITIKGEGLSSLYPIYATDVANSIAKAMFSEGSKGKTLFILGNEEITALNLAYKLREKTLKLTGKLFEIHFAKDSLGEDMNDRVLQRTQIKQEAKRAQELLNLVPETSLDSGIETTIKWFKKSIVDSKQHLQDEKQAKLAQISKKSPVKHQKQVKSQTEMKKKKFMGGKANKIFIKLFLILMSVALLFPLITIVTLGSGAVSLKAAFENSKKAEFLKAEKQARWSGLFFKKAGDQLIAATRLLPLPNTNRAIASTLDNLIQTGETTSQTLIHLARAGNQGLALKQKLFDEEGGDFQQNINSLSNELRITSSKLALLEIQLAALQKQSSNKIFLALNINVGNVQKIIRQKREILTDAVNLLNLTPQLLGIGDEKTYLILLQNNAELRPTGGFIGSYALVSLKNGKLEKFTVEDVYTADGQLKGHVEPPEEIKKHLGEAGWYLRDANWDPDFPTAATKIEWFFEKETGTKVDGVIALNLIVIKDILDAVGPVKLQDYDEMITADNLFEIAEERSEINFFPGSTQKRDFLGKLASNLLYTLENAQTKQILGIATAVSKSLNGKQLLFFTHNSKTQKALNELGWDGSLANTSCDQDLVNCDKTYIALREANLGVNKANHFLKRNVSINLTVGEDKTETTLKIWYFNNSSENKWPGGTYKNYMRIYFDETKEIKSVKVNGEKLLESQISLKAEHQKQVIGFLMNVPPQKEGIVEIVTSEDGVEFENNQAKIAMLVQKQPGTQSDPLSITFNYPEGVLETTISINGKVQKKTSPLTLNLSTDIDLVVDLQKTQ